MAKSVSDNTASSRPPRKLPKTAWKKGQPSPNPKGAPKRGQSWTELIKEYGELTPSEAAAKSLELSKQFLKIGDGVTLKQAVVMRVYASLLFEPQPGLLNAFLERAEGKVADKIVIDDWRKDAESVGIDADALIKDLFAKVVPPE